MEAFLLYRAELTLNKGHDYFVIVEKDIPKAHMLSRAIIGDADGNDATALIRVYKGAATDNPSAFDANDVMQNLRQQYPGEFR